MTTETMPATYPWDEPTAPSAVHAASDRLCASMFVRRNTPIDSSEHAGLNGNRVVVLHISDLTIHIGLGSDEDAERIEVCDRLIRELIGIRDNATQRLAESAGTPS